MSLAFDLALVAALLATLASGRAPAPAAFLAFILAVVATGRSDFEHVLKLAAHPALVAVISLVVFSSVLSRIAWLRRMLFARNPQGLRRTLARFLGAVGLVSSVVPNTAVVGAFIGPASNRQDTSAHDLLMPLSYMALAGGLLTPFGTSASLLVVEAARGSGVNLDVGHFASAGIFVVAAVFTALFLFAPRILKRPQEPASDDTEDYHVEAKVDPGSPLVGRSIAQNRIRDLQGFYLAEIVRGKRVIAPVSPDEVIEAGDVLIFVGDGRQIDEIMNFQGLTIETLPGPGRDANLYRAVVSADSILAGRTLKTAGFRARFNASVLAIRRGQERLSGKLGSITLRSGDLLLLAGGPDFAKRDNVKPNLHVLEAGAPTSRDLTGREAIFATGAFLVFVVLALSQAASFALLAFLLAVSSVVFGWLSPNHVARNFPFTLGIALWGALTLSDHLVSSGVADLIAGFIGAAANGATPIVALALIFGLAWLLTELTSNAAAALAALPIGLATAAQVGAPPEAFALAVAYGASASFLMPFGYQTHLLVMSPGDYTFGDFLRLGGVVLVFYAAAALSAISLLHL